MLLRMFDKRLRGYRAIGYARGTAPLRREEVDDEAIADDGDPLGLSTLRRPTE